VESGEISSETDDEESEGAKGGAAKDENEGGSNKLRANKHKVKSEDKTAILLKHAFDENEDVLHDEKWEDDMEDYFQSICNSIGFPEVKVILEQKEGSILIKAETIQTTEEIFKHLKLTQFRGKSLDPELLSEFEFFKRFPLSDLF